MTITLLKPCYVDGALHDVGYTTTLSDAEEAYFVSIGLATRTAPSTTMVAPYDTVGWHDSSDGIDDDTSAVILTDFDIHYQIDALGSRQEYSKT